VNARKRAAALAAVVTAGLLVLLALVRAAGGDTTPTTTEPSTATVTTTAADPRVPRLVRKLAHERVLLRRSRHRTLAMVRTLRHRPSTQEALTLACSTYGSCATLRRRAWCESRDDPSAQNASGASGLFQFLPSTWRSTPYAGASIFSPYASALAAGWMQAHGRGGEWSCR
jgi:hypothetical protein